MRVLSKGRIILASLGILILLFSGVVGYYLFLIETSHQETTANLRTLTTPGPQISMALLNQSGAYDSRFTYDQVASADVETLSKPSGEWSYTNLVVGYTFLTPFAINDTYASGPECSPDGKPRTAVSIFYSGSPPTNCHASLLVLLVNQTDPHQSTFAYEVPSVSYVFYLWFKPTHIYLFFATNLDYQPPTVEQLAAANFLDQESRQIPQSQTYPFDPFNSRYYQILSEDTQTLISTNGTWTSGNVTVSYAVMSGGLWGPRNRPVLVLSADLGNVHACGNGCGPSGAVLLIANNNVTDSSHIANYSTAISGSGMIPHAFPLYTPDGHYIDWHLYFFLVTYTR